MGNNKKTILIIVLAVVAILAVVGGVFAYMFLATDTFKSGQQLFEKYLKQNTEELSEIVSLEQLVQLEDKLKENKYEENLTISTENSELVSLFEEITLDTQNDPINKKYYGKLGISNSDLEEPLEIEYMKESDMYSLRFTNAVKQFLTIQNANLSELAEKLGIHEDLIEYIPNSIDFESFSTDKIKITEEEKKAEADKYINLLYSNIPEEKYTKSKDVVITVNGKTITTNAYILTLNMQEVKDLSIKLLETLEQDELILNKLQLVDEIIQDYATISIKDSFIEELQLALEQLKEIKIADDDENVVITMYEQKGKTVRLKAEQGLAYITLDTMEVEGKQQIEFNFTSIDKDNIQSSNKITITRENKNTLKIRLTNIEGEEQQSIDLIVEVVQNENNVVMNISINMNEGTLLINRNINFVDDIQYDVELDESNNIILNDVTAERITSILGIIGPKLREEYIDPLSGILMGIGSDVMGNADLSQTEIAMFNGKFSIYQGTNISTSEVNALLRSVLLHNNQEKLSETEFYVRVTGDIALDEKATNAPTLEGSQYYKVECKMDDEGRINEIVVTETAISLENIP